MALLILVLSFIVTYLISLAFITFAPMIKVAIKPELALTHKDKRDTPSIGGVAFTVGTTLVTLAFPTRFEPTVIIPLLALQLFAIIGLIDDLAKVHSSHGDGLSSPMKMVLQTLAASTLLGILILTKSIDTTLSVPFLAQGGIQVGSWYGLFALVYILYFVNAVNITDGLDALAVGASFPLLLLLALFSLRAHLPFSPSLMGALGAFFLFNKKPAKYFMGDTGSHALGGYIAVSALMLKVEVVIMVASGLFLMELASSLIQIIAIRSTGRKVFLIAPLHHHYEQVGVSERTIVGRFTLVSWVCALLAFLLFLVTGW